MRSLVIATVLTLSLAACSHPAEDPGAESTAGPSPSASLSPASGFTVTSVDFADGDELADWATANAYDGQCVGDNLNPALAWSDAPSGTAAYAITLIDRGAGNYIHWVHIDIPGDVTSVARGGSADLPGVETATNETPGYFGPCPPGPDHRYEFTVYALDAPLGLPEGAAFVDVITAIKSHELADTSISGMRSGPA